MDFGAILAFILIFVFILAILVGIAYYGVKSSSYPGDSNTTTSASDSRASKKQQHRQKSLANGKAKPKSAATKRKETSISESESSGGIEEDPIVIIPDPFTNQLTSRFAGAISATKSQHHQNGGVVHRKTPVAVTDTKPQSAQSASVSTTTVPVNVVTATKSTPPPQPILATNIGPSSVELKTDIKSKPKATVKPHFTAASLATQKEEDSKPKLIKVNVVNSKALCEFFF